MNTNQGLGSRHPTPQSRSPIPVPKSPTACGSAGWQGEGILPPRFSSWAPPPQCQGDCVTLGAARWPHPDPGLSLLVHYLSPLWALVLCSCKILAPSALLPVCSSSVATCPAVLALGGHSCLHRHPTNQHSLSGVTDSASSLLCPDQWTIPCPDPLSPQTLAAGRWSRAVAVFRSGLACTQILLSLSASRMSSLTVVCKCLEEAGCAPARTLTGWWPGPCVGEDRGSCRSRVADPGQCRLSPASSLGLPWENWKADRTVTTEDAISVQGLAWRANPLKVDR